MRFSKIYIEITNICNLNCSFCSNNKRLKEEMSLDNFEKILKKITPYTKMIYLHVKGEPLLHSKLEDILELTKKYNFKVKITTNGTLLKEKYDILKEFTNIKQINISLQSENHDKNYFYNVFDIATKLSKKIPIVYRIWLLNEYTLNKLSTMIVDKIIDYYKLDNNIQKELLNNKNIMIQKNIFLDKDNKFIWPENIKKSSDKFGKCLGTRSHIAILVNGDVVPCCLDSNGIITFGNIFHNNLEEILENKLFQEINLGFKKGVVVHNLCKNCEFRKARFKLSK